MGGSYSIVSRHRCNILICPIFSTHKGYTQMEYPFVYAPWVVQYIIWHVLCKPREHTGMGQVFAFARAGGSGILCKPECYTGIETVQVCLAHW